MKRVENLPEWVSPTLPTRQPVNPSTRLRCRSCGMEIHPAAAVGGYDTHPSCDRRSS